MPAPPRNAPTLVLLAAGMGSRYGGVKQLDGVGPGGATLMDYSIYDAARAGFGRVVFVIRPELDEAFRTTILPRYAGRLEVATVHQRLADVPAGESLPAGRTKPWGTGQAVLAAAAEVQGPFAVANADDFYGAAAFQAAAEFLRTPSPNGTPVFVLVGYELRDTLSEQGTVNRGACRVSADGWLAGIEEVFDIARSADGTLVGRGHEGHVALAPDALVSMNLWCFTPAVFPLLAAGFARAFPTLGATGEYLLPTAMEAALRRGEARVRVLDAGSRWYGLTHPADRPRVAAALAALVRAGVYPERPWA